MDSVCHPAQSQSSDDVLNLNELTDRCMGNLEFVERVLHRFQELLDGDVAEITAAAAVTDLERIGQIAHRIKGAAANVAAKALVKVAAEIESAAKVNDAQTVGSRLPILSAECDRFARCIPTFPTVPCETA